MLESEISRKVAQSIEPPIHTKGHGGYLIHVSVKTHTHTLDLHFSTMSSKPIIYYLTQASVAELQAKVHELSLYIQDKERSRYNVAADIMAKYSSQIQRPVDLLAVLLSMVLANAEFYHQLRAAAPDKCVFDNIVNFIHQQLVRLARGDYPSGGLTMVVWEITEFAMAEVDEFGMQRRPDRPPFPNKLTSKQPSCV